MFILGDESQHRGKIPWVTGSLLVLNILAFCVQRFVGEPFTNGFSLVPREISEFRDLVGPERVKVKVPVNYYYDRQARQFRTGYDHQYVTIHHYRGPFPIVLTLLTSMFLHGDWLHLIGNLWFLAVFGRNVECALDHGRFLAFYVTCGVLGGIAYVLSDMTSAIPCLGASGAISGVMGAYVAIYPLNKIRMWFGWWVGVVELPAFVVVGFWFLFQYLAAFWALESGLQDGVAYWEHIGGFLSGIGIIWATVLYLKYEQASQPPPDVEANADAASTANASTHELPVAEPVDPFATFLASSTPEEQATGQER
jgi:membrane associated rhomboid family serine protease